MARRALTLAIATACAVSLAACGSEGVDVQDSADIERGAQLFAQRCGGCHEMWKTGSEGGAQSVGDRERIDGPNFNVRPETEDQVLYAIRNGGFSGAVMPENIVVGKDAQDVAAFLAKYAGKGPSD